MASKKCQVRKIKDPVMWVHKSVAKERKIIYLVLASRAVRYPSGDRSRIIYIGTTKNGAPRIGKSTIVRALKAFDRNKGIYGVNELEVHVWHTKPVKGTSIWRIFEAAALRAFANTYYALPKYNVKGKRTRNEWKYFNELTLRRHLRSLGEVGRRRKKRT